MSPNLHPDCQLGRLDTFPTLSVWGSVGSTGCCNTGRFAVIWKDPRWRARVGLAYRRTRGGSFGLGRGMMASRSATSVGPLGSWSSSSAIWLRPHRSGRAAFPHPALPGSGPHHAVRGVQGWVIRGWGRGKLRVTVSNQSQPTRRFFWLRRLRQMNQMRRTSCRNPFRERQLCGRPK